MKRSHFLSVMVSEVNSTFKICNNMDNGLGKKLLTLFLGGLTLPYILYKTYIVFTIPYIEVAVTTGCNLKCEGCSNLMPLYKNPHNSDPDKVIASVKSLIKASKEIKLMTFLGGEPFLNKQLYKCINYAVSKREIKNIYITTNGTILPNEENLNCLKTKKVTVLLSDYNIVSKNKLLDILTEYGIQFLIRKYDSWMDYGSVNKRNFNEVILKKSYRGCAAAECKTVLEGKLYTCPRSAHCDLLGITVGSHNDFVVLNNDSAGMLRKKIKKLYSLNFAAACDHCNPPWNRAAIDSGKQTAKG